MLRVASCLWFQGSFRAPKVDMSGKTVVLTGPTRGGIGYETAKGLHEFGASPVILGARNLVSAQSVADELTGSKLLRCDLGDADSVAEFAAGVQRELDGTPPDVLVCNAGAIIKNHTLSADDVELTFRVCALAHLDLIRRLKPKRTVWVTGEIYCISRGPADPFLKESGWEAYNRSCLARLLLLRELKDRAAAESSDQEFVAVHPGVIATSLVDEPSRLMRMLTITPELGAQASIYTATCASEELHQEDTLPFFSNKHGWKTLPKEDTAMSKEDAVALFDQCIKLLDKH